MFSGYFDYTLRIKISHPNIKAMIILMSRALFASKYRCLKVACTTRFYKLLGKGEKAVN